MDRKQIARNLVLARGEISRYKVCNDLGISYSTLAMYETGRRVPKDEHKMKIAAYYGKTIEELFYCIA